jgi:pyroglutamyl-peptidase
MIHVGMAGGRDFYSVERRGHRDGYFMEDVDGLVLGDERGRYGDGEEEKWVWAGCPEELETSVDIDDVWRRWRGALPVCLSRPLSFIGT